ARNVRLDEDGRLGATPTDLFHSLSSHGAVLHELRDQAVSRLSPAVGASRALGTHARAPLARASARVRMVLDRRSAADGSRGLAPLELAPSRGSKPRAVEGALRRLRLVSDCIRDVCAPEYLVCCDERVHSRSRTGACIVRRLLRQPA